MKDSKEALNKLLENMQCEGCHIECYLKNEEKEECYKWYETIKQDLDRLEKLEKENQELLVNKNVAQGIAIQLKDENNKLKEVIKMLKDNLQLVLKQDIDPLLNRKVYAIQLSKNYKLYTGFEVTQEKYELTKEVFENV